MFEGLRVRQALHRIESRLVRNLTLEDFAANWQDVAQIFALLQKSRSAQEQFSDRIQSTLGQIVSAERESTLQVAHELEIRPADALHLPFFINLLAPVARSLPNTLDDALIAICTALAQSLRKLSDEGQITSVQITGQLAQKKNLIDELEKNATRLIEALEGKALRSRRQFLKETVASAVTGLAINAGAFASLSAVLLAKASRLPRRDKDALAILISRPNNPIERLGAYFSDVYIARIELAFGCQARTIIKDAKSSDLRDVLKDPAIQNICILGHGSDASWTASDKVVTLGDLGDLTAIRKNGYLLKHTCGLPTEGVTRYFLTEDLIRKIKILGILFDIYLCRLDTDKIIVQAQNDASIDIRSFVSCSSDRHKADTESLIAKRQQELNELLEQRIKRETLGIPFFSPQNVAHWNRVTNVIDFMLNPFADLSVPDRFAVEARETAQRSPQQEQRRY